MPQADQAAVLQPEFANNSMDGSPLENISGFNGLSMISGVEKKLVKALIWFNILWLAWRFFKKPALALRRVRQLSQLRDNYRDQYKIVKYAKIGGRYFFTYTAPGWPSAAFNQYIRSNFKKLSPGYESEGLLSVIFAITKKCGYACEHCFEWEALNKTEVLNREDLVGITHAFQELGISNLILSGGEPLNRMEDIIYLLQRINRGTDVWLFTSGYHLSAQKAQRLKEAGLTGIAVSLENWQPAAQDRFRGRSGAFTWAEQAVRNANNAKLAVCLSLCATKEFVNEANLHQYALLAKSWGASFIQLIEPKAVGHYGGLDVQLSAAQIQLLEKFYIDMNFNLTNRHFPSVIYHEFYSRKLGCSGGGNHYLYIDTDGDVHNCSFCQKKLFSASGKSLKENIRRMRATGCTSFKTNSKKLNETS